MYGLEEIIDMNERATAEAEIVQDERDPLDDPAFIKSALISALTALRLIENGADGPVVANAARLAIGREAGWLTDAEVREQSAKFDDAAEVEARKSAIILSDT